MAEYKIYKIKDDRIFDPPVVFESPEEAAAIDRAKQLVDGCDVRLWQGSRFVIGIGWRTLSVVVCCRAGRYWPNRPLRRLRI